MAQHLRSLLDLTAPELDRLLVLAARLKQDRLSHRAALAGKSVAVIFEKQSTRTRVSFEVGAFQLGAQALILSSSGGAGMQMGRGETIGDTAQVLSRYVDAIVIRTYAQSVVDELAEFGSVPVVNALTDQYHPCQALADVLTMREHYGDVRGLKLVYAGAGNNVAHSLMYAGPRGGFDVVIACARGLEPDPAVLELAQTAAAAAGASVTVEHDLAVAAKGAHALYTDVWVSMGQDGEAAALRARLAGYTITEETMSLADPRAIFMHCLPAHRGEEMTAGVLDGPQSIVFNQAENRLHTQKALLLLLLGAEPWA